MLNMVLHIFLIIMLPFAFGLGLVRGGKTRWEWWSAVVMTLSVMSWAFVIGRWDMAGYLFRVLLPLWTVVAAVIGWRRMRRLGSELPRGSIRNFSVMLNLVLAIVFVAQAGLGIVGFSTDESAIELAFPLQDGVYYVGQGGSTVILNYHVAYPPQDYALDIVRLNSLGYRAAGVYPAQLDKYVIFGDPLYSPCTGDVMAVRDGLPDHRPPLRDAERPEGNYMAIRCQGVDVLMAHLQEGSVRVSEGESVVAGQLLGRVGNSGNTTEPHLHIHAERRIEFPDGRVERVGVPIRFEGRFLGRNSIVLAR